MSGCIPQTRHQPSFGVRKPMKTEPVQPNKRLCSEFGISPEKAKLTTQNTRKASFLCTITTPHLTACRATSPHSLTPTLSGGRVHYSAQPDITMADAIFKRTDVDAHASTFTLASLQVHTCSWHLQCTGSDQHNILPPRLDGFAAGAIDIQHPASRRGCTGGGEGWRHVGMEKALSAVFVSITSPHGNGPTCTLSRLTFK